MKSRRYEPKDFAQIKAWGKQWGADYQQDQFPMTGFIVDDVAAYFLYQTDSNACWLENLVTNKLADPKEKDRAISLIIEDILKEAKTLGYTVAYATTNLVSLAKRAKELGSIVKAGQVLLIKDLTHKTH